MAAPDLIAQSISRYVSWLAAHESLGMALCWTAVRTDADASLLMDLLSPDWVREDAVDLAQLEASSDTDESVREHTGWLISTGEHVALLEVNGFGGSCRAGLRACAEQVASLAGIFWNVNLVNQLAVARNGQLATAELWAEAEITDDSPLIARYQPFLTPETDLRAFGLAVVETETGLRLDDDVVAGKWPLVRFAARQEAAEAQSARGSADESLYRALVAATDAKFIAAKAFAADYAARSTGLDHEPAVQAAIAAIRAGQQPGHDSELTRDLGRLGMRLQQEVQDSPFKPGDLNDPALRRLQALTVVEWMSRMQRHYEDADEDFDLTEHLQEVWQHVIWSVGDSWPVLRQQLVDLTEQPQAW